LSEASTHTVEQVVRKQLSDALGGARGMLEAAVPTVAFTVIFLTQHDLKLAILVSLSCAAVLLAIRLAQRSSVQFVLNAFVGIGIGALFAWRAARGGGDEGEQALAYFLPGLLYNLGYAAIMVFTIVIRWPLVGFIVGSVAGDPTAWHQDRNVVRLCSRLTWLPGATAGGRPTPRSPPSAWPSWSWGGRCRWACSRSWCGCCRATPPRSSPASPSPSSSSDPGRHASRSAFAFSRLERTSREYILMTRPSANLKTPPSDSDSCSQFTLVPEPSSVKVKVMA
jgi:hypothetical protein